jgi:hypothetical protein
MNEGPVSEERAAAERLLARAAEQERAGDSPATPERSNSGSMAPRKRISIEA